MTTKIVPFTFNGAEVRTITIEGEPWFISTDVARILGAQSASGITRMIDDEDKGFHKVVTPGGAQDLVIINESGLFTAMLRSNNPNAKPLRRWVTSEVLPMIRKTGSYITPAAAPTPVSLDLDAIRQLNTAVGILLAANETVTARAVVAEEFQAAIENADGLTPREFHKHYLSDMKETDFNQFLYTRGLLIDQRGARYDPKTGTRKSGKQHRHPKASGKAYFYLHAVVDADDNRYEHVRVRPGAPELALVQLFAKHGYPTNSDLKAMSA